MSDEDNWKQFQGTELGSLLAGIYGGNKPKINYPKLNKIKSAPNIEESTWRPTINKPTAVDPRKTTRRPIEGHLVIPRMRGGRKNTPLALIDCVPKRKNENEIRNEIDDIKLKATYYRPAHMATRGDAEKVRCGEIFAFKGGKCLPQELTALVSDLCPHEREQQLKHVKINESYKIIGGQTYKVDPNAARSKDETRVPHEEVALSLTLNISYSYYYLPPRHSRIRFVLKLRKEECI